MTENLLNSFIEDCTSRIRTMLLEDISSSKSMTDGQLKHYTFNRFNLTLNFSTNEALIEDDLNPDVSGEMKLDLESFRKALMHY